MKSFTINNLDGSLNHKNDFLDLFGVWSEKDYTEFKAKTTLFDRINPSDWQ